jgi:hypothetical protein
MLLLYFRPGIKIPLFNDIFQKFVSVILFHSTYIHIPSQKFWGSDI